MLSKIWQIGDLTNLTNLIFHAEAVGWDTYFNFFFCMCLSYCLIQSSKLHNGFSLHLVSSEPCTGTHTQPLTSFEVLQGHCSLCTSSLDRAGATRSYTHVFSKSQLHLSCTTCHNLLESFEQVVPNYNEITSRQGNIFLPPERTGVAKHNWLCSQMKKPHSLQKSSFQPWGAQGLWSTPKCSLLTQGKSFGLWKKCVLAGRREQMGGRCFLHWDGSA